MRKLKVDENLPDEVAELLRDAEHDVMTVLDQQLGGQADEDVFACCLAEERALVTFDLDFADIRAYPPPDSHGVIVLRLERQDKKHVLAVLAQLLPRLDQEELTRKLWIVDEHSVRIRE